LTSAPEGPVRILYHESTGSSGGEVLAVIQWPCGSSDGGDPMLIEITAIDEKKGTVTAYALDSKGSTTGDPMTLLDMTAIEDD